MGLRPVLTGFLLFSSVCGAFTAEIFRCDFEEAGLCGFVQQSADGFDWEKRGGTTPTRETGPSGDHTRVNGTGQYIHIEASNKNAGSLARLETPAFISLDKVSTKQFCLQFFYHMYGKHMGTLNVYAEIIDNHRSASNHLIWTKTGEQGNTWFETKVTINVTDDTEEFKVIFEGIRGENFKSDIGVDDVSITDVSCEEKLFTDLPRKDCREPGTISNMASTAVVVDLVASDNRTVYKMANSSAGAQVSPVDSPEITMTTLLIIVCCGVAFWTMIFLFVTIYILSHKPPTVEQLMKQYQSKSIAQQQNRSADELDTIAMGTTIVNQTADINNSINDGLVATANCNHNHVDVEDRKDRHYVDKQIDTGFYDSKSVELSEVSSDESDDLALRCQDSDDDSSLFRELLQRFPRISNSNLPTS